MPGRRASQGPGPRAHYCGGTVNGSETTNPKTDETLKKSRYSDDIYDLVFISYVSRTGIWYIYSYTYPALLALLSALLFVVSSASIPDSVPCLPCISCGIRSL